MRENSFPWKASGVNTSTAGLSVDYPWNNILPFSLSVCSKNPTPNHCKLRSRVEGTKQDVFFVRRYPEYTAHHHYSASKTGVTWWGSARERSGCCHHPLSWLSSGRRRARQSWADTLVTGAAVGWQGSPELWGGSKGKCKEQADSYSETFPLCKINIL